jgi:hypothetical protein
MGTLSGQGRTPLSALMLDPKLTAAGWQMAFFGNYDDEPAAVYHPGLNAALAAGEALRHVDTGGTFRPDEAWMVERRVSEMQASGKKIFDAPKIRIANDPVPGSPVSIERTTYFNGLVTNELCLKTYRPCDGLEIDGTDKAFPLATIPRLSRSRMSNHLGVSTLAFDEDGKMILCVTGSASAVSAGKISASASGSVDQEDIEGAETLTDAAIASINRELTEEVGLTEDIVVQTRIIAFLRNLERGGKPEFVGVSKILTKFSEAATVVSDVEQGFIDGHMVLDVAVLGIDGVSEWMAKNQSRTSYALRSSWEFFCLEYARPGSRLSAWLRT